MTPALIAAVVLAYVMLRSAPSVWRSWRRFVIRRALRRLLMPYRIARAAGAQAAAADAASYSDEPPEGFGPDDGLLGGLIRIVEGGGHWVSGGIVRPQPSKPPKPTEPGRQPLAKPFTRAIPAHARSLPWEDLHAFAGEKPKRDPYYGLINSGQPIAFGCPVCELEDAPLTSGSRPCQYCGTAFKLMGSHVFWWRAEGPAVEPWSPSKGVRP